MKPTSRCIPGLWGVAAAVVLFHASPAAAQPKLTEEQILAKFKHEPTVQQLQDASIRYYQVHPDRIRSLRRNARLKALMPNFKGKFSNSIYHSNRGMVDALYRTLGNKEDERANGDSMGYTLEASWDLDRLVFNAEVLDVQSLIGILDGVVREVTTVYYIRRRLQIDMLLRPPVDLASTISQRIRVEELTGLLDAMTGGYMTRAISRGKSSLGRTIKRPTKPVKVSKPAKAAKPAKPVKTAE